MNLKRYIKDGKIKYMNSIIVYKDNMQIINPPESMIIEDGWEEYIIPNLTDEEIFQNRKNEIKDDIIKYDSSDEVNIFYINGLRVWLDKSTRAGLKLRFEAEIALGKTETILWYNTQQFPLSLENAIQMLYALEIYASECYDNTQSHLANIDKLTTIEDLEKYNYTVGYPQKLNF